MKVCGIVAEYNPLHNGHHYQLREARRLSCCDFVVVAMSGAFVQRGEPAGWDKWTRARWTLTAGADLVLEIPAAYCLQAAPGFAFGGVGTLAATGLLTHLSFGAECADLSLLSRFAALEESGAFCAALRLSLNAGKSYPAARYDAVCALLPEQEAFLWKEPNTLLAIEYLRVLSRLAPEVQPLPIPRQGSGYHAETLEETFSSASAIRRALSEGNLQQALPSLPSFVSETAQFSQPAVFDRLILPLLYALRTSSPEALRKIQGVGEGIESSLYQGGAGISLADVMEYCKSKRYTLARTQRMLSGILVGYTKELCALANQKPPYLRVLGVRKTALPLLGELGKRSAAPLVVRKADHAKLPDDARKLLELDFRASDVAALAFPAPQPARRDYTEPLILWKESLPE